MMKNRITDVLSTKKNILSVFYTAGFPLLNDTALIAVQLERSGADIIEIGIPFSDPVADGPVIQDSNKIALHNGMTLSLLLSQVKEIRKSVTLPIILMGYLNPVIQFGVESFCKAAAEAGVDGLILPDLPMDEYQEQYKAIVESSGLSMTFLISPTTSDDRIRKIDELSTGFIYAVSASSTTGKKGNFSNEQKLYFEKLKSMNLKNPFLIGFGISSHQNFCEACEYSAGAIVGSAFIDMLKSSSQKEIDIDQFVQTIKN